MAKRESPINAPTHQNLLADAKALLQARLAELEGMSQAQLQETIEALTVDESSVSDTWFERSPYLYFIVDDDFRILKANKNALSALSEYTILEQSLLDLVSEKDRSGFDVWLKELSDNHLPRRITISLTNHHVFHVASELTPEKLGQIERGARLIVMHYVSPQELGGSQYVPSFVDNFALLFKASRDACCLLNYQEGKFLEINEGFEQLLGYRRSEIVGERAKTLNIWQNPQQLSRILDYLNHHGVCHDMPAFVIRKDGHLISVLISVSLVEYNGVLYSVTVVKDISEQLSAEQALAHSEEKYKRFFECAQVALGRSTTDNGKLIECNELFAHMMGFKDIEECLAQYVASEHYVDPKERERLLELVAKDGSVQNFEMQVRRKTGEIIWVSYSAKIYPDQGYIEGGAIEITERKNLEKSLAQLEARWRTILQHAPVSIYVLDLDGTIQYVNRSIVGRSIEQVVGKNIANFTPPASRQEMVDMQKAVMATGKPYSLSAVSKNHDGENVYVQTIIGPIWIDGKVEQLVVSAVDITPQKKAQMALEEAEQNWRSLLQYIPASVCHIDNNGLVKYINHSLSGRPIEKILGKPLDSFVPKHIASNVRSRIDRVIATGMQEPYEFSIDGPSQLHFQCNMGPVILGGKTKGIIFIALDITKQKNTERELKEAQGKWQLLLENLPNSVYMVDKSGMVQFLNHSPTGRLVEEVVGRPLNHFTVPEYKDLVIDTIKQVVETGKSELIELESMGPIGRRVLRCQYSPIKLDNSPIDNIIVIANDITEEKKREQERIAFAEQKRRAQKMEMIGTMAAGTAHSLNNYLTPILGFASMAKQEAEEGSMLEGDLEQIILAAKSAKGLVKQITEAGVIKEVDSQELSLPGLINDTVRLLRAKKRENCKIKSLVDIQTPITVYGNPDQLQVVIMELSTNALDAMQVKGGELIIELEQIHVTQEFLKQHRQVGATLRPGDYAKISIKDTGHGMSEAVLERIFEPFYTRKEVGKGTGLGLSVAQRILMNHKGDIEYQSKEGEGTICSVYLPLMTNPVAEESLVDNNIKHTRMTEQH